MHTISIDDVASFAFSQLTAHAHSLAELGWIEAPLLDRYDEAVGSLTVTSQELNTVVAKGALRCGYHVALAGMHAVIDFAEGREH